MRLTTAQAVVRYLAAQHSLRDGQRRRLVPAMLGIFGHGNVAGMGQALDQYRDRLPYIQSRNEQSMGHIATAYAKASRRTATLAATSSIGPGSTNLVTAAALATINRLPLLLFPSDTYATRRQGPVLQQLEHPSYGDWSVNDCFRPVARFFDRISRPEQLITALPEAMRILTDPVEAGTCVISLPQDIQSEAYDFPDEFFRERDREIVRPQPIPDQVQRVADMLSRARQPLIIAGGGVIYSGAEQQLRSLADEFGIPVAETFAGKGAVTQDAWWNIGGIGLEGNPATNAIAAQADLVLSVGTRLTDFATASQSIFANSAVRFASVNVTGHDAYKQGATTILADAGAALDALRNAATVRPNPEWEATVRAARAEWAPQREEALAAPGGAPLTQGQLIGAMQRHVRSGDTVIAAAGGAPGDMLKVWDATGGRTAHIEFGYSCMGYELPAALGVRLAQPEGQVISFIGDGTFLMQPTELVTAAQENLDITVVISENHGFQVIHRLQMLRAGQEFGNEFRRREGRLDDSALSGDYLELDLAAVAAGLGATARRAETAAELERALDEARTAKGPFVIVVPTLPHADLPGAGVWWDVAPAEVSEQDWVRAKRAEYEKDITAQRYYG